MDGGTPRFARRARRALWLRELVQEGLAARRSDAIAAVVPAALAQLDRAGAARQAGARRWLAWLAGRDLGATAAPWQSWWAAARATLKPPPGGEPRRPRPRTP